MASEPSVNQIDTIAVFLHVKGVSDANVSVSHQ